MKNFRTYIKNIYNDISNLSFESRLEHLWKQFGQTKTHLFKKQISPVVFVLATIWVIVSSGIAFGSMIALFGSLLVVYFILTRIFGFQVDQLNSVRI